MPTRHLDLPYILDSQAQKHVTHNEGLDLLDVVVQLAAKERRAAPPESPAEGDRYLIGAPATGAWSGREGEIAVAEGEGWIVLAPRSGWVCYVIAERAALVYHEGSWRPVSRSPSKVLVWTNFDNYTAAEAWTTIALNQAGLNDENDFDASTYRFTPPIAGLYAFTFSLGWKQNQANVPARLSARLRTGTGVIVGPFSTTVLIEDEATLTGTASVVLGAGESVVLQGRLAGADGYFRRELSRLTGYLVA